MGRNSVTPSMTPRMVTASESDIAGMISFPRRLQGTDKTPRLTAVHGGWSAVESNAEHGAQGVAAPCYRGGRRRGTLAHPAAEEPVPSQPEEEDPGRARLLRVRAGGRLAVLQGSL